ncbi:Clavaminate synthase-like protein [Lactarius pseudohatsudake]|nr:Clavaminate synthase-like protein [Lactarius pseudohatsudake]
MPDASHATPLPFPDDVPLDVALLQAGDEHEIDRLWKAPDGADGEVDAIFEMGAHTWRYLSRRIRGTSLPAIATDASGALDSAEFIDVSYDDALAFPTVVHRRYPCVVEERMDSARPFVRKSMEANQTLIDVSQRPPWATAGKTPASTPEAPDKAAIGAHTDFGSLSFLHIRLGGLQVLPPGTDEWKYVKPMPGHAICNLGDAMAILSAGVLRSNLHRVVPPPKAQASFDRWSLAFFTRPMNSVPSRLW